MTFASPTIRPTSFAVSLNPCSSTSAMAILSPILGRARISTSGAVLILGVRSIGGKEGSLCKLYCRRAADTAAGPSYDRDTAFVDDGVDLVVHGGDGVVGVRPQGGGLAAGVGGGEDHGMV